MAWHADLSAQQLWHILLSWQLHEALSSVPVLLLLPLKFARLNHHHYRVIIDHRPSQALLLQKQKNLLYSRPSAWHDGSA
jgi:hypothetical protein